MVKHFYGDEAMSQEPVFRWPKMFREGRKEIERNFLGNFVICTLICNTFILLIFGTYAVRFVLFENMVWVFTTVLDLDSWE